MEGLISSLASSARAGSDEGLVATQSDLDKIKESGIDEDTKFMLVRELSLRQAISNEQLVDFLDLKDHNIVRVIIDDLPTETAQYVLDKSMERGIKVDVWNIRAFSLRSAQGDPVKTLDWCYHLPREYSLPAFNLAYRGWVSADPNSASKSLGSLSKGIHKDDGIQILVQTAIKDDDRVTARKWIEQVSDEALKDQLTSDLGYK